MTLDAERRDQQRRTEDRIETKLDGLVIELHEHVALAERVHDELKEMVRRALYGNGKVGLFEWVRGLAGRLQNLMEWKHTHEREHADQAEGRKGDRRYFERRLLDMAWDAVKIALGVLAGILVYQATRGGP